MENLKLSNHFQLSPKDKTVSVSPLLPVNYDYPHALFFIDGPLLRLASNTTIGLSLESGPKSVVSSIVELKNIFDQWRRIDMPLPSVSGSPPDAVLPPGAGTSAVDSKYRPIIDLPVNVTYLPVKREYQQCSYKVNPSGHR